MSEVKSRAWWAGAFATVAAQCLLAAAVLAANGKEIALLAVVFGVMVAVMAIGEWSAASAKQDSLHEWWDDTLARALRVRVDSGADEGPAGDPGGEP